MAGRPRRTRIYGANYNIGESYYKSALDNLDKKQFGSLNKESSPITLSKPSRNMDDLLPSNSIFQKGIHDDEPLFDYIPKEPIRKSLPIFNDDESDEEIRSSMKRITDLKKSNQSFLDDFTAIKERNRNSLEISRFPKAKPILDFDDMTSDLATATSDIFKSTASATSASSRANATKERLANIEFEMSERMDKQVQREKRSTNLKKFLSESGVEASNKVVKKVTF
ncbi:uncharacterized protein LOC129911695 [Episyrphus balteatus]|uniref:uncharacterized protein LOC129911695 n=1 Tax=Episyrphus balteatus TaxID=286459 RepID=UPI00248585BF|nr:uncharacterized protein LOC129911695 [Episyrphus balteatus]